MLNVQRIAFGALLGIACLSAPAPALSASGQNPGHCATAGTTKEKCQFEAQLNTQAPWPVGGAPGNAQASLGIRLDNNVTGILFNYYTSGNNAPQPITPLFIDNKNGADLFVPQSTEAEFNAFLQAAYNGSVSNVTLSYAISPLPYTAKSQGCPSLMNTGSLISACGVSGAQTCPILVPQPAQSGRPDWSQRSGSNSPSSVNSYVRLPGTIRNPGTADPITVGTTDQNSTIQFMYQECVTDAESHSSCSKFEEDQSVKFKAVASVGTTVWNTTYTWGADSISTGYRASVNGGDWQNVADCSAAPSINGVCGTSDNQSFSSAPSSNLCSYGNLEAAPSGEGPWSWTCKGVNGGSDASCTASKQSDGGGHQGGTFDESGMDVFGNCCCTSGGCSFTCGACSGSGGGGACGGNSPKCN